LLKSYPYFNAQNVLLSAHFTEKKQLSKAIDYVFKNAGALDDVSNLYVQI
jgi:hypothetical protein